MLDFSFAVMHIPSMNNVPEIRYDHMTDRALLDEESTAALRALSARWAAPKVHPVAQRAQRRAVALRRAWTAMAQLRAVEPLHTPFPLIRRASGVTRFALAPLACINIH